MYLKQLNLTNFRSCENLQVPLREGLTILVGENNGGKSNIIDAIRLVTAPLGGRRELYCEPADIRFGGIATSFELEALYAGLTPSQKGSFVSAALDKNMDPVRFGITYASSASGAYARPSLWAGASRLSPEAGCHDLIRHVYLPPLRDAKRALASGNPGRIYSLLNHFLNPGQSSADIAKSLARSSSDPILDRVDNAVELGLGALTSGVRRQTAALGFSSDEKLIDIARDLRFKMADYGIEPEDLRYSGHGYANLLYLATIAVELEKMDDADLTIFLVEEPEAHLHPQLQAAVLGYLRDRADASKGLQKEGGGPAGQLQVVVATHSPNLSAWVDSSDMVFVRTALPKPASTSAVAPAQDATAAPPEVPAKPQRRTTQCLPLGELPLTGVERRKVDRYLDVTKSALLFGGRVMMVEGIAEALLLPAIAEKITLKGRADALRIFRSAVFLPIDGVDFEPYVKLVLATYGEVRIADRVVVITDGDKTTVEAGEPLPGALRQTKLDALAKSFGAADLLSVHINTYSLEAELVEAGNEALLKVAYLELHSRSEEKWNAAASLVGEERAKGILSLFGDTRKGDFAQIVAESVIEGTDFHVPAYITAAIEALVK